MNQSLDIRQEAYFPINFRIFGFILILAGLLQWVAETSFPVKVILTIVLEVIALIFITTRYGLKISVDSKSYTIYTWLLGFKIGKPATFSNIDDIYINQVTDHATVTSRAGTTLGYKKQLYKAFMKLDTGDTIHLDTDENEGQLKKRVDAYLELLKPVRT